MPILPPICTSLPKARKRCAISAVVVDLPLVPVMATDGALGACARRSRQKISISPMISTPASCAFFTVQCGSGCVSGTPGDKTKEENCDQSACPRSTGANPSPSAFSRADGLSSQAATAAPPAFSASAVARPEPPRPNSATRLPAKVVAAIIQRTFSVDRPTSASTKAMIQKRTTICDSDQPNCSK